MTARTAFKLFLTGTLAAFVANVTPVYLVRLTSDQYVGIQGLVMGILMGKLFLIAGFVIAILAAAFLLKRLRVPRPLGISVVGTIWYYLAVTLYGSIYYQPDVSALAGFATLLVGGITFVAAYLIFSRLPYDLQKPKIIAATCLLTIPALLIISFAATYLENWSYTNYYSSANKQKRAGNDIKFKAYKPTYVPDGAKITQSALFGYERDYFTSDDLHVRIDVGGGGMVAYFHQSEPFKGMEAYVDIPKVCNLYNLTEAIEFKYGGYVPSEPYIQDSGCVKVATTTNGRVIYGESVPFSPEDITSYYYTRIGDTVIGISYKPWGEYADKTGELVKMVESLEEFDISELMPKK